MEDYGHILGADLRAVTGLVSALIFETYHMMATGEAPDKIRG